METRPKTIKYKEFELRKKSSDRGDYWCVVKFTTGEEWYPKLIDRATEDVLIGLCEEWKYPRAQGKKGYLYTKEFYNKCMDILCPKYAIMSPESVVVDDIRKEIEQIYHGEFNPNGKSK